MNFLMTMLRRIKGIFPMIKDRKVAWWKKAIIIAALVYLFLPVDVIPPVIPVFGWADDLAVWAALLYFMGDDLDAHISAPAGYRSGKAESTLHFSRPRRVSRERKPPARDRPHPRKIRNRG